MADLSLFKPGFKFVGDYQGTVTYFKNNIVKGSDGVAYKCIVSSVTGVDPVTDTSHVDWDVFIATSTLNVSSTQIDRISSTVFGINAGTTWQWKGNEWALEIASNQITLVRMKQNCNCNCNCNCSYVDCDCASNCNCYSDCNCASNCNCDCSWYMQNCIPFPLTDCNPGTNCFYLCSVQCNCNCTPSSNCNCASNCNCYSNCNCSGNCDCNCSPV